MSTRQFDKAFLWQTIGIGLAPIFVAMLSFALGRYVNHWYGFGFACLNILLLVWLGIKHARSCSTRLIWLIGCSCYLVMVWFELSKAL